MKSKTWLWAVLLTLLWSPAFLFMKVALQEIPPFTLAAGRILLAAIALTIVMWQQKLRLPRFGTVWRRFALLGLLLYVLPYILISWGEQYMDSGLASLLIGTDSLFTMLIAHFFINDDRLTKAKTVGALVGFGGLGLLAAPQLAGGISATSGGVTAVTLAALSYGIGGVYAKKRQPKTKPLVTTAAQLWLATLFLLPVSLLWERPTTLPMPSMTAVTAVVALAIICTALPSVIYLWLIRFTKVTDLAMIAYLVPIIGLILGIVVLGERPGWHTWLGGGLILAGMMVMNSNFKLIFKRRQQRLSLERATVKLDLNP